MYTPPRGLPNFLETKSSITIPLQIESLGFSSLVVPPPLYTTLPNTDKARLYAEANTIIYYPPKAQVVLIKNARVTQNQNILTEPHIWYDIKKTNRDFHQSGRKKHYDNGG